MHFWPKLLGKSPLDGATYLWTDSSHFSVHSLCLCIVEMAILVWLKKDWTFAGNTEPLYKRFFGLNRQSDDHTNYWKFIDTYMNQTQVCLHYDFGFYIRPGASRL